MRRSSAGRATALTRAEALDLYIENAASNVPELLLCHVESVPFSGASAGRATSLDGTGHVEGGDATGQIPPRHGAGAGARAEPQASGSDPSAFGADEHSPGTALRVTRVERIATEDITAASTTPFSPYAAEQSAAELLRFLRVRETPT
jgi:hypothetical protein